MFRVWLLHLFGVPLAAFAHSVLQFAHSPTLEWHDLALFPVHFFLGTVVGFPILGAAYTLQAFLFLGLRALGAGPVLQVPAGGLIQVGLVGLWAATVGVEPSLAGRFPLTPPLLGAAFLAGALVAAVACRYGPPRTPPPPQRPATSPATPSPRPS